MKFVLLSVVCLFGGVLAKPALQKRDILPGDPRYGTDYHNHHHQESHAVKIPHTSYGPPNYSPGQPINYQETVHHTVQQTVQPIQQSLPVPSVSVSNFKPSESVETISNGYLSPVVQPTQGPVVYQKPQVIHQEEHHHIVPEQQGNLVPVFAATPAPVVHYVSSQPAQTQHVHHQQQPSNGYLGPAIQAAGQSTVQHPIDSYGSPVFQQQLPQVTVQHYPQSSGSHVHAQTQSHNHAVQQQHVQTVNAVQEQVHHVHQPLQPVLRHEVLQIQPAITRQIVYQSEPQNHDTSYFPSSVQALDSSNNGGYVQQVTGQHFHSDLASAGLGHQEQASHTNVFQSDFAPVPQQQAIPVQTHVQVTKQVHYPTQVQQVTGHQTYGTPSLAQQVDLRSFGQTEHADSESVRIESSEDKHAQSGSHQEQTQLIGSNGGYVY